MMMPRTTRPIRNALRALTADECAELFRLAGDGADHDLCPHGAVMRGRARVLLAVHHGATCAEAARAADRRCGTAVARMVARFNHEGIAAVMPRHGGGRRRTYSDAHRARILAAVCRVAVRAGPRGWSVATVQRALREDGDDRLRTVSHPVVRQVLRAAGWQWDRAPGWNPQPAAPGSRSDPSAIPAGARTDVGGAEP